MITNTHDVLGLIPKEEVSLVFESLTDDFFDNIIRWWYGDSVRIDKKEDFSPNSYPCNDNQCIKK